MTEYERLRAALDKKLAADPSLRAVVKRIKNGTATLADSAEYARVLSHILGREVSANVLDLDDRAGVVTQLLRDCYEDVNSIYAQVQTLLDEQAGIHINPQKPDFPAERVDQFTHSLIDPTVKDSVIKRRAGAGTETITKSYHDDCIKKNAQFRYDAGLKCYIVRIGTQCCEWCSEVAGKYEFGDQPDGIFRRHDNCDCTIIYDGQVLRGKQNADGSRSKTWEELPNANAADYVPPTLSEAEGRAIEQRNLAQIRGLKINNSSIDNSSGNGIIESERRISIRNVDTHGLRNESPLTQTQISQVKNYAVKLGMPPDQIRYGEHYYTAYGSTFDMLYIGTDVYPSENPVRANSRLSWKCAIAHEIVGHRETCLKGWEQSNLLYDEIQASIRAARFAPDLSQTERINLLRDACERANKNGLRLKDVRHKLHIDVR